MIEYTQAEILRMNACHALQSALEELRGDSTDFYLAGNHCASAMKLIDALGYTIASEASGVAA